MAKGINAEEKPFLPLLLLVDNGHPVPRIGIQCDPRADGEALRADGGRFLLRDRDAGGVSVESEGAPADALNVAVESADFPFSASCAVAHCKAVILLKRPLCNQTVLLPTGNSHPRPADQDGRKIQTGIP